VVFGTARTPQPEQRILYINGVPQSLTAGEYTCDRCGTSILPGARCCCWSVWTAEQRQPEPWEGDYLTSADAPHCYLHADQPATHSLNIPCAPDGKIAVCDECFRAEPTSPLRKQLFDKYAASHGARIQAKRAVDPYWKEL